MRVKILLMLVVSMFMSAGAWAQDSDDDGLEDSADNCIDVPNAGVAQCDTDGDGYGNACDFDYDQNLFYGRSQVAPITTDAELMAADSVTAIDSGVGTDHDCIDGIVLGNDSGLSRMQSLGTEPGPSGLFCAGTVPCVDEDRDGVECAIGQDGPAGDDDARTVEILRGSNHGEVLRRGGRPRVRHR